MATPMSASTLVRILKAEGCRVEEHRSWRTHNRNHKGDWGPINGVMLHHTVTRGTDGTVRLCYEGYSGLPGPLCHGVIDKQGVIHLVGWGRANHAGGGDPRVLDAVIAESYGATPPGPNRGNYNGVDGNARFVGFECINMGDGEDPWPNAQLDAMERASAAICRHYGWTAKSVIGHLEWSSDKVDPRGFGMPWMRGRVQDRLDHKPGADANQASPQQEDDDMQLNDKVAISDWVKKTFPNQKGLQDGEISVNTALGSGYAYAHIAADNSRKILAQLGAQRGVIEKLVDAIADGGGLTAEQAQAAAEAGARAALAELGETLTKEN